MIANHRATIAVGILASLLALPSGAADDKPAEPKGNNDLAKLQGVWVREGKVWVITGNEIGIYSPMSRVTSKDQFKIDTSKRPHEIDFLYTRYRHDHAIYEVEGDTLRVCITPKENPRPTKFETDNQKVALWVFKRATLVKASVGELQQTFHGNEALADETYTDRLVKVTGTIRRVRRGEMGYVLEVSQTPGDKPAFFLHFDFPWDARSQLAKLVSGKKVTVQGLCRGKSKGESGEDAVLFLSSAIIAPKE